MSENTVESGVDFDVLEEKVNRAVEMIRRLREDNRKLESENLRLKMDLDAAGGATRDRLDHLNGQIASLEKEKAGFLDERRMIARRVEEALSKLEFLESESVPH